MSRNPNRFKLPHNRDLTSQYFPHWEDQYIDYSKQARQLALQAGYFLDGKGDTVRAGQHPTATIDIATHLGNTHVGCGVVLHPEKLSDEAGASYPLIGRNRIILLALIDVLSLLKEPHAVTVTCASDYLVDNMMQGRAHHWRRNGWKKADGNPVKSRDLWEQILALGDQHRLRFESTRKARTARMSQAEALALQRLVASGTSTRQTNGKATM